MPGIFLSVKPIVSIHGADREKTNNFYVNK